VLHTLAPIQFHFKHPVHIIVTEIFVSFTILCAFNIFNPVYQTAVAM